MEHIKTVGIIAGIFDVIHPGYIELFESSSNIFDEIIVLLNSGENLEDSKKLLPICTVSERKKRLLAIKYIDNVMVYDSESALYLILKKLSGVGHSKKYIRILGTDYIGKNFTGDDLSMDIFFHSRSSHNWSTTAYKKKIFQQYLEKNPESVNLILSDINISEHS